MIRSLGHGMVVMRDEVMSRGSRVYECLSVVSTSIVYKTGRVERGPRYMFRKLRTCSITIYTYLKIVENPPNRSNPYFQLFSGMYIL